MKTLKDENLDARYAVAWGFIESGERSREPPAIIHSGHSTDSPIVSPEFPVPNVNHPPLANKIADEIADFLLSELKTKNHQLMKETLSFLRKLGGNRAKEELKNWLRTITIKQYSKRPNSNC